MSRGNNKKLLEDVRDVMRLKHYSIHTERTYSDWIKRFVQYHKMEQISGRFNLAVKDKRIPIPIVLPPSQYPILICPFPPQNWMLT